MALPKPPRRPTALDRLAETLLALEAVEKSLEQVAFERLNEAGRVAIRGVLASIAEAKRGCGASIEALIGRPRKLD